MSYIGGSMKRATAPILALALWVSAALPAPAAPLTVLTYNLGLLSVFGSDFVPIVSDRAAAAPVELARFARERSPDVLVLQEVWKNAQATAITKALAPLGYTVVRPRGLAVTGRAGGLLVAVKRPLSVASWSFSVFRKSTFIDSLGRKGVLRAEIENADTGARFVLLATHTVALDTDRGTPIDQKQVAALASQLQRVLVVLEQASASGGLPALMVGDFNVGPGYGDASYRLIADAPGIREAGIAAPAGASLVTWDPGNPLVTFGRYPNEPAAKIDHVFFRDGGAWRWTASRVEVVSAGTVGGLSLVPSKGAAPVPTPLSDHYGLLATLELAPVR
jgi:endonuclease/exonuclease/phosphatase family metal-dependent hydrolase